MNCLLGGFILICMFICSDSDNDVWERFFSNPNRKNSLECIQLIQKEKSVPTAEVFDRFLGILNTGNKNALEISFTLKKYSDGENTEALDITLGDLLEKDPRGVLLRLKKENYGRDELEGILLNLGEDYVDEKDLTLSKYEKRKDLISHITDRSLDDLISLSISILEEEIKQTEKANYNE